MRRQSRRFWQLDLDAEDKTISLLETIDGIMKSQLVKLSSFDAKDFTRAIKNYMTDARIMHCLFVALEGLLFQVESYRETRLYVFLTEELSLEISKAYLKIF